MKIIDIHSHINIKPLSENVEEIVSRMKEEGVGTITVGVDYATSKSAVELAEKYPEILWATVGLHPTDNLKEEFDFEKYLELGKNEKVVAIGECGLDYYRLVISDKGLVDSENQKIKERQKELFKKHIELAIKLNKPLMIHARPSKNTMDAYEDVLFVLSDLPEASRQKLVANFHFFVGNLSIAKKIVENGWTVSYDGPITFSSDYDEVIKWLPIENIMAETDAPFAAPEPYRGKTCEPWMVKEVIKKIAELKGLSIEEVQNKIRENVKRVFGI